MAQEEQHEGLPGLCLCPCQSASLPVQPSYFSLPAPPSPLPIAVATTVNKPLAYYNLLSPLFLQLEHPPPPTMPPCLPSLPPPPSRRPRDL